ncbi:MAG TPA: c-type cytochrome domain-containing protein [Lacipirellulaceae bacterium]|nr:c-type cytochrome domain-containing protein [Lacipirellulaceae bacterium]
MLNLVELFSVCRRTLARRTSEGLAVITLACASGLCAGATAQAQDKVTYDDHLAPIFRQRCSSCHNPTAKKADLDVTNYLALMQGGASGAVIEAGDASASYLFALVAHEAEPYMPQGADKIPDNEIKLLRQWIDGGALENKGSKAVKKKTSMVAAVEIDPGKRPEVIPMPARMVLEPHYLLPKPSMARSLATSPWAPLVAMTSQRQVLLYNTQTLELVGVFPFPEGQPNVVRFSRDGRLLLAGGGHPAASGKVIVWDITTGERLFEVGNELDVVLAADISADYKRVVLGGPQRIVRVYSTESGELQYEIAKHTDWVLAAEFSPDGVLLATADRNGGLHMWEAHTGREFLTLNGHTAAVTALSWRADSNLLASASEDATVRLWEPENGTQVKNWNAKSALLSLEFTRDARLVTCGRDQVTRLWDQDGKQLMESAAIGDVAVSTTFCDESLRAITASWAGVVQAYKADDAAVLGTLATNPPKLEERLAAAQQQLQEKTAASAPLAEAMRKAEEAAASAQAALATAQQEAAGLQSKVDALAAEAGQLAQSRAASDTERTNAATTLAQVRSAHSLVGESLRHMTEALAALPGDAELTALQNQLTERSKALETRAAELQTKITELTATMEATDTKLNDTNTALEASRKELEAATQKVSGLQKQAGDLAAAAEAARQPAKAAEAEVAKLQAGVARWQDEIAFRDKISALQAQLDSAAKAAAEREAELQKAQEQLAAAKTSVDAASAKLSEATTSIGQLEADIRRARGIK